MNFGFTAEQDLLREQVRSLLDRECPSSRVRELMSTPSGYDEAFHNRIGSLGWTAIPFTEEHGGLGLGMVELTVVLEEMGRHLLPSPFWATVALAGTVLSIAGDDEQRRRLLPGICSGTTRATVAQVEASGRWDAAGIQLPAHRTADGYVLTGEKHFVPDAHIADWMIVAARTVGLAGVGDAGGAEDSHPGLPGDGVTARPGDGTPAPSEGGVTLFLIDPRAPGVTVTPLQVMDQTRRMCSVRFDGVAVSDDAVVGLPGQGWRSLATALDRTLVAISADLCGTAERAMEMSVAYAKERRQFGRPIGSYQGISHRCADMLVQVEQARSLTYFAAWAIDSGASEARRAAAMAKAYSGEAARLVTAAAVQVHGGIGFTWEHDIHLYFRRASWGEAIQGDTTHHREAVANLLEL